MARTKNENKEKEEIKEEVVTETTEKVEEPKTEEITSTGETVEELAGEKTEAPVEEAKVEENASKEKEDAKVQVTEETEKVPTVKEVFRDKYDEKVVYKIGDIFIEDKKITDNKPVKVKDGQYKVSEYRYAELKRSLYVD